MTSRYLALLAFSFLPFSPFSLKAAQKTPAQAQASTASALEVGGVRFSIPATWSPVPPEPATPARIGQWNLPQGGQAVAFYFGEGKGGDVQANLDTLAKMATTTTGAPAPRVGLGTMKSGSLQSSWFACYGIYSGDPLRSGIPALPKPQWGLIGVAVEFPGGPVYFRITGPDALIRTLTPLLGKRDGLFSSVVPVPPAPTASSAATAAPKTGEPKGSGTKK